MPQWQQYVVFDILILYVKMYKTSSRRSDETITTDKTTKEVKSEEEKRINRTKSKKKNNKTFDETNLDTVARLNITYGNINFSTKRQIKRNHFDVKFHLIIHHHNIYLNGRVETENVSFDRSSSFVWYLVGCWLSTKCLGTFRMQTCLS